MDTGVTLFLEDKFESGVRDRDNTAEIGNNSAEIGDDATEIVDIARKWNANFNAKLHPEWRLE